MQRTTPQPLTLQYTFHRIIEEVWVLVVSSKILENSWMLVFGFLAVLIEIRVVDFQITVNSAHWKISWELVVKTVYFEQPLMLLNFLGSIAWTARRRAAARRNCQWLVVKAGSCQLGKANQKKTDDGTRPTQYFFCLSTCSQDKTYIWVWRESLIYTIYRTRPRPIHGAFGNYVWWLKTQRKYWKGIAQVWY